MIFNISRPVWILLTVVSSASLATSEKDVIYHSSIVHKNEMNKEIFSDNPMAQFSKWYKAAKILKNNIHSEAGVLATILPDNTPDVRAVRIKKITKEGFIFYSNPQSNKIKQLKDNPNAAIGFVWHEGINKSFQVSIQGKISPYTSSKKHVFNVNGNVKEIYWQAYILIPTHIKFSQAKRYNYDGILEYVDYVLVNKQWVRKTLPSYLAAGGVKSDNYIQEYK